MFAACPRCEYPLTGLPENHACPECGLRYDSDSKIYRPAAGFVPAIGTIGFVGSIFFALQVLRLMHRASAGFRPYVLGGGMALVGLFTWLIWRYQGSAKKQKLVAVLPDGLLIRLASDRAQEIPWTNISNVTANRGMLAVSIFIRDKKTIQTVGGVFRSKAEAFDLANRAMRRIIYGSNYQIQDGVVEEKSILEVTDENSVAVDLKMYRKANPRWYAFPIIAGGLIAMTVVPISGRTRIFLALIIVLAAIVAEIISFVQAVRIPQRLLINRAGVTLKRGDESILQLPWSEIKNANLSRVQGMFSIGGDGGQTLFMSPYAALGRFNVIKHAAGEIVRLKEIYGLERSQCSKDIEKTSV